jgi:hypothetical protein
LRLPNDDLCARRHQRHGTCEDLDYPGHDGRLMLAVGPDNRMGEFLVRFVVETLFQGLLELVAAAGHAVTRALVPRLTSDRVKVAPLSERLAVARRWYGLHRLTDGTPVLGERLATAIGLLVIALTLAALVIVVKSF